MNCNKLKKPFMIVSLLGIANIASAGAMGPVDEPLTWTGAYAGINAGGVKGNSNFGWTNIVEAPNAFATGAAIVLPAAADAKLNNTNFTYGGQIGANYQLGFFVAGVEADYARTGFSAARSAVSLGDTNGGPLTIVPGFINESFSSDWLSTVRGRLGVAKSNWLFYGTGGWAIANVKYADSNCFPTAAVPICNASHSDSNRKGWTGGGGLEWRFAKHFSVKAEYLYVKLSNTSYRSVGLSATGLTPFPGATITHNHTLTENIGRIGLNYQFS